MAYHKGQPVSWHWGAHEAYGKIAEVHPRKITLTIDGTQVTRNGTPDDPAYEIVQDDGQRVLKLGHELYPREH